MPSTDSPPKFKYPTILIVGDWFVDEYWFLVRHYSDVSSHAGPLHYHVLSKPDEPVKDLCGAGLIARVMYEMREFKIQKADVKTFISKHVSISEYQKNNMNKNDNVTAHIFSKTMEKISETSAYSTSKPSFNDFEPNYQIHGIGRWSTADEKLLTHLIHSRCRRHFSLCSGYSLNPTHCPVPESHEHLELHNLNAQNGSTTRVIRTYQYKGGEYKQLSRVDWERPITETTEAAANYKCIDDIVQKIKQTDSIFDIVVDDHVKGVICNGFITALKKCIGEPTRWYVRTKNKGIDPTYGERWPDWIESIGKIDLLNVSSEIAARAFPIGTLLTKNEQITRNVFFILNRLKVDHPNIKHIVFGSDSFEVVVLIDNFIVSARIIEKTKHPDLKKIGWATAFFSTLIQELRVQINDANNGIEGNISDIIKNVMEKSYALVGVPAPNLSVDQKETHGEITKNIEEGKDSTVATSLVLQGNPIRPWMDIKKEWEAAFDKKGVIGDGKHRRLELWRAQTDLPGYICCVQQKREAIRRMWTKMRAFKESSDIKSSLGILLRADPAAGKTHLASQLAAALDFHLVAHDISQMVDRNDLIDFFDSVASAQADKEGRVVIFVDEINATLGGSPVYGAFLSPLEGKYYIRRGVKCILKPCIWLFAGTQKQKCAMNEAISSREEKLEDFESRLSLIEEIDYESMRERCGNDLEPKNPDPAVLEKEARLEQVYMGAYSIIQEFGDVQVIQESVLDVFYELNPAEGPLRLIRRLGGYLENVQYGRVNLDDNCTSMEWRRAIEKSRIRTRELNQGYIPIVQK